MTITVKNRKDINNKELNTSVHDACFYSLKTTYTNGKYYYDFMASDGYEQKEAFLFCFTGVTSCIYTGENHSYLIGGSINSWYSLPSYPANELASWSLTENELKELEQHGAWKTNSIRKNIKMWEHEYSGQLESLEKLFKKPGSPEKLFKVVFFLSTPAFLEIECEKLVFKRTKLG